MGIQGLLPLLKPIQKPVSIAEDFAGQVIAVDAYCWLHKGAYGCAMELVEGKKSFVYVNYVLKRINMLLHFNVKPILVFDGSYLPSKAGQEEQRRKTRQENKAKGLAFLRAGNRQQALECFQKCVDISPEMALEVIKECRKKGVDCIVAPYEADAQLAYLMKTGITSAVISEDSDLLVYGCQKVIFKMDAYGHGMAIDLADLSKLTDLKLHEFTQEKFRHMCILSGCDYLPSVKGIGLHKALKLLRKSSSVDKAIRSLRLDAKMQVPADYEKSFKQADETFLYQLVFDPISKKLVPLNELPEGIELGDLEFAGPYPREVIANFSPCKTKVLDLGSDGKSGDDVDIESDSLTPVTTSSFGHSVMSKRGKTGYDVQKNLSGLLLNSQQSAKTKKPFLPPGQKRKAEEDAVDDDSLVNMYTALKPRPMLTRAPSNVERKGSSTLGHGLKRAKFKNPFKVNGQDMESKDKTEFSRYFNLAASPERKEQNEDNEVTNSECQDEDEASAFSTGDPGAVLTLLKDITAEDSSGNEVGKGSNDEGDIEENKENEFHSCEVSSSSERLSAKNFEESQERNSSQRISDTSSKLQKQSVLRNHSLNTQTGNKSLGELFGYKPTVKKRRLDNSKSVPSQAIANEKTDIPIPPLEIIDIDSGYLSDTEQSTDGDTPTPTSSAIAHLTPLSSGRSLPLSQGSAVGTKTMKKQIRLNSKPGSRSTGLGRCRSMGMSRPKKKAQSGSSNKEAQTPTVSSTLFKYFEYEKRKGPKVNEFTQ
ncbi:Rad2 nuclease [Porites harrisoni]